MQSTQQMLVQSRERAFLNRCKTPLKTFIGGTVVGLFCGLTISAILLDIIFIK